MLGLGELVSPVDTPGYPPVNTLVTSTSFELGASILVSTLRGIYCFDFDFDSQKAR